MSSHQSPPGLQVHLPKLVCPSGAPPPSCVEPIWRPLSDAAFRQDETHPSLPHISWYFSHYFPLSVRTAESPLPQKEGNHYERIFENDPRKTSSPPRPPKRFCIMPSACAQVFLLPLHFPPFTPQKNKIPSWLAHTSVAGILNEGGLRRLRLTWYGPLRAVIHREDEYVLGFCSLLSLLILYPE